MNVSQITSQPQLVGVIGYFDEPIPCNDCSTPLPRRVHNAVEWLYGGQESRDLGTLAAMIEEAMIQNAKAVAQGVTAASDAQMAEWAMRSWAMGTCATGDLAAAVRHSGLVDADGNTECERLDAARWCLDPTPDHQGDEDRRSFTCTLGAGHEGDHCFTWESVFGNG